MAVPDRRVTNEELSQRVDTSDAWIVERTGIRERRVAAEGETTASLAIEAGAAAIKRADLSPSDIGCCIVATCTPEQPMPPTSSFVQEALGLRCGAFDLDAACSGFVYSLVIGASLVSTTGAPVLVIGSETLSRITDPDDRSTCVLFGDGAGAAVVQAADDERGILSSFMKSDGTLAELLYRPGGGAKIPFDLAMLDDKSHLVKMAGPEVFKAAVRSMCEAAEQALKRAGVTSEDIDLLVPHQANNRIIEATAKYAGIPMEKVFVNVDRYGNMSSASVPVALDEAREQGRIRDGSLVLMVAFGAGFTWAANVVRM